LVEGFPEWRAAGFPIGQGDAPARPLASWPSRRN